MERDVRHPGPLIVAEYLAPMGADVADFATFCGIDRGRFEAIANGLSSFTVAECVRVARALDLSSDRLVAMQTKYDLAAARLDSGLARAGLYQGPAAPAFREAYALHGVLAETSDAAHEGYCWFFQQEIPGARGYEGLHALWRGDTLRVYDSDRRPIYVGTVLKDLDGRMLLPYVAFQTWSAWFFDRYAADLAIGEEHGAFLEQLAAGDA